MTTHKQWVKCDTASAFPEHCCPPWESPPPSQPRHQRNSSCLTVWVMGGNMSLRSAERWRPCPTALGQPLSLTVPYRAWPFPMSLGIRFFRKTVFSSSTVTTRGAWLRSITVLGEPDVFDLTVLQILIMLDCQALKSKWQIWKPISYLCNACSHKYVSDSDFLFRLCFIIYFCR